MFGAAFAQTNGAIRGHSRTVRRAVLNPVVAWYVCTRRTRSTRLLVGVDPTHSVGWVIEGLSDTEIEHRLRAAADKRWQELWDAVKALALEPEKGRWAGGETVETIVVDGVEKPVIQMPYVIYSAAVFDVLAKVYGLGASQPFDWRAWDGLNRYPNGRGLDEAPVAESTRMITAVVRADRFGEGTLLASLEDGTFMAAVGRLRRWYEEQEFGAGHGPGLGEDPDAGAGP